MPWKVPISTDYGFGDDYDAQNVFIHLVLRSNRSEKAVVKVGRKFVTLTKGQSVFSARFYGDLACGGSKDRAARALVRLKNRYTMCDTTATADCTVVSLKNYSDLVGLDSECDTSATLARQQRDESKKDKKEKTDKKTLPPFPLTDESKTYGRSLGFTDADLSEFESYWTEGADTGKARWQKEKVFDVRRRLHWRASMFDEWGHAKPPKNSQLFVPRFQ